MKSMTKSVAEEQLSLILRGRLDGHENDVSKVTYHTLLDLCAWPAARVQAQKGPRGLADYRAEGNSGDAFYFEVKRHGRPLVPEAIEKYLRSDSSATRLEWGVLTNGVVWEFWLLGCALGQLGQTRPVRVARLNVVREAPRRIALHRLADLLHYRTGWRGLRDRLLSSDEILELVLANTVQVSEKYQDVYASIFSGRPLTISAVFDLARGSTPRPAAYAASVVALRHPRVAKVFAKAFQKIFGGRRPGIERVATCIRWALPLPGEEFWRQL